MCKEELQGLLRIILMKYLNIGLITLFLVSFSNSANSQVNAMVDFGEEELVTDDRECMLAIRDGKILSSMPTNIYTDQNNHADAILITVLYNHYIYAIELVGNYFGKCIYKNSFPK